MQFIKFKCLAAAAAAAAVAVAAFSCGSSRLDTCNFSLTANSFSFILTNLTLRTLFPAPSDGGQSYGFSAHDRSFEQGSQIPQSLSLLSSIL
jgi:hypothetical protein